MSKNKNSDINYYVYILRCSDNSLYTGYAIDVERRLREHNGAEKKSGAKYTASRRPVRVVYTENFATKGEAMSREALIKQLTKPQKEALIASGPDDAALNQ